MSTLTSLNAKKIADHLGKQKTLAKGAHAYKYCNPQAFDPFTTTIQNNEIITRKVLFLGLGYNASEDTKDICKNIEEIYTFECVDFINACENAHVDISTLENAKYLDEQELFNFLEKEEELESLAIYIYRQNLILFPNYWNTLFLKIETLLNARNEFVEKKDVENKENRKEKQKNVFFASFTKDLLHYEIKQALEENDYTCISCTPKKIDEKSSILQINEDSYHYIKDIIVNNRPEFFLSVNGRFIDAHGRIFSLLNHYNIKLALWLVDNVWNILSAYKNDFWKECHLFVTDCSFIPQLRAQGAKYVHYLPLAGSKQMQMQENIDELPEIELLFVGHTAFKDKDKFFSAVEKKKINIEKYKRELLDYYDNNSQFLPNFNTIYAKHSEKENIDLWASHSFREISFIASELDSYHKKYWLNATEERLTIIGDDGWKSLLNNPKVLPPVDYYTSLANYYSKAKYTLNIPSMLMPSALTQRHFDVWLSNGYLFSAPTKGLEIFTPHAREIMEVRSPKELVKNMENLNLNVMHYNDCKKYMQEEIKSKHLYKHRIAYIKDALNC